MRAGFHLFSFDLFEAPRRPKLEISDDAEARGNAPKPTQADEESEEWARKEAADRAYWGFNYFPFF